LPPVVASEAGQPVLAAHVDFLARRRAERGIALGPPVLAAAAPAAWRHYDALVDPAGGHPWRGLMTALLRGAGVAEADAAPIVDWLWSEQPHANLWRGQIPGMVAPPRERAGP